MERGSGGGELSGTYQKGAASKLVWACGISFASNQSRSLLGCTRGGVLGAGCTYVHTTMDLGSITRAEFSVT